MCTLTVRINVTGPSRAIDNTPSRLELNVSSPARLEMPTLLRPVAATAESLSKDDDNSASAKGEISVDQHNAVVFQELCKALKCPICLDNIKDMTASKCGHVFCRECIALAVTASKKCPTCRAKLIMKDLHPLYL